MSLETDMVAALQQVVPRSFPVTAPYDTPLPYLVWQRIGGKASDYLDDPLPESRNANVQLTVWAASLLEAIALMNGTLAVLVASPVLHVSLSGEQRDAYDEGDALLGVQQDISVWGDRS